MNLPPPRLTIARASRLLRSSITSQQLCAHSLNLAIFGEDSLRLNAYTKLLSAKDVAEQASVSDQRIKSGQAKSLLDGIPVTIKANIAVGRWWELPTACSAILQGNTEVNTTDDVYESDVSRILLKECGAVLIGITNMDEFGMGSLGTYNGSVPTYNPLPWMQRIGTLIGPNTNDLDRHFLDQIIDSTSCNPHRLKIDELQQLLDEVKYWTSSDMEVKDKSKSPLYSPGGSSSGAAVATAHGSSLLSIGTDTGGSLRLPAAWTSTVGFKPTYGSISRYGVVSYASSLDTVGFVTGSSECAEIAWACLRGTKESKQDWNSYISRDSTARLYHSYDTSPETDAEPTGTNENPLDGIRIGIPAAFSLHESPRLISSAWSRGASFLQSKGATLVSIPESKVSSQWVKLSCAAYYVLACAEASSNLSRYDGVRYGKNHDVKQDTISSNGDTESVFADMTTLEQHISATRATGFGDEVQRRVLAGTSVLSSDRFHTHYEAAATVRAKLSQSLEKTFRCSVAEEDSDGVDVILVPTALSFPVVIDSLKGSGLDSTTAFANDVMTIPMSLGGFPSVSVPIHGSIPNTEQHSGANDQVGLQLFGPRGSEELVLKAARTLEFA
ncbi:hypothetical protein ACHAWO_004460 [Cyclotella atomus]|jgi:aspartyl-tRNA(Asn)/glutamyl-tRNA(Gln) amidotransferase subunit A|uniref:Amidase domain-containing protein n=1 Tax=Cyclotella atomus TaxID=382360 RepID=A0ABD3NYR4_9STRA